ncbi:MAG: type IX secretion system sortase PorU, partial [Cyclonatronaceae bacterium]
MNTAAEAQQLRVAYDTPEFTEYEFQNDSLKISAPLFLDVPFVNGQRRYRIIEQSFERRPVGEAETQPQSSALTRQLSPEAEQQLRSVLQSSDIPFIQAGTPQEHRKQLKSTLTINASRLDERQNEYIIARSLRIRVYKEQSWSPQARQKAAELADKNESTPHPLSSGQWYKIPILRSGIYRLDADYLSDLGLNVETLDPEKIQLWGMAGNELPRPNSVARPEFSQLPIRVEGEADGSFGDNDAVVFYAKDVNERIFDPEARSWSHKIHAYADTNFVFLKVGEENGRRLSPYQSSGQIEREIDRFRDFLWLEEELYMPEANHRSGTLWFGQLFTPEFSQQVIMQDTLPGFIEGSSITFDARMAGRSRSVGNFNFSLNGANFGSASVSPITNLNSSTGRAANVSNVFRQINGVSLPENDQFEISASYSVATAESRGWVDYITLRAERLLAPKNGILHFLTPDDAPLNPTGPARYTFTGFNGQPLVMDVTNPVEPVLIEASGSGGNWSAEYRYDAGRQLVAATRFYTPVPGQAVGNQHIRGNRDFPDYLIITDESLLEQAEELAAYRRSQNGFVTSIVTQRQIFNEFSGGVPDPVAIRDYVKHLYDVAGLNEDQLPDYLLLMGNASFDYKGIEDGVPMRNLVFNFQHYVDSDNLGRVGTYGSDDYFGFLDENEGQWRSFNQQNRMDLKIGRLPVQTPEQAELVIEKIKTFENAEQRGDWRTLFTFTADNHLNSSSNDRDLHAYNADFTAETIDEDESGIRLRKLYQFSFPVENTPAGQRVPQATDALVRQINEGTLVVNFSGHGSEQTLTQQRLFQSSDIPRLTNRERPMIMITA